MKKWWLVLLIGLLFRPNISLALDNGIVVEPPMQDLVVEATDKTVVMTINYTNNSNSLIGLKLSTIDFGALDESGGVAFLGLNKNVIDKKYALASWVSLSENVVNLQPKTSKKIKVTILNKESLSPGGHYAAVLATLEQEGEGENKVWLNQGLSTLLYVTKKGGEKFDLKFNQLVTHKILWNLEDNVEVRLQNQGNVHLVPRGLAQVVSRKNVEVARGVLNADSSIILPETFKWYNVIIKKNNKLIIPGKYQLVLNYRFDGEENFSTKKIDFFYIGLEGIVLIGLIIILLGSFLIRFILLI